MSSTHSCLRTIRGLWQHWRDKVQLQQKQCILHQRSRHAKKARINELLREAATAATDLTAVFQLLRKLAPRTQA